MEEKCVICGKPAEYISFKFTSPVCKECALEQAKKIGAERGIKEEYIELEDYYTQPCEEMHNIDKSFTL